MIRVCCVALALMLNLPAAVQAAEPPLSRAVRQGADKGFKTCAPAMDRIVRFLHEDDEAYTHLGVWSTTDTDKSSFTTLTLQEFEDGRRINHVSAVQNAAGKCDTSFLSVIPVLTQTCAKLLQTEFRDWNFYAKMGEANVYEEPGNAGSNAMLAPLGEGCLLIRQTNFLGE